MNATSSSDGRHSSAGSSSSRSSPAMTAWRWGGPDAAPETRPRAPRSSTIARASEAAAASAQLVSKKRGRFRRGRWRIEGGRDDPGDGRANERRQELLGVGDDERDDVAALEAGAPQPRGNAVSRRANVRVRAGPWVAIPEERVAGAACRIPRRALRPASSMLGITRWRALRRGRRPGPRPGRRCGVAGTSFSGIEMSNMSSSSATTSRTWSESKPRSATRSLDSVGSIGRRLTFLRTSMTPDSIREGAASAIAEG